MSLLSKLERLERMASSRSGDLEASPELIENLCRILSEIANRPKPTTIQGQIDELRQHLAEAKENLKDYEATDEPWKSFLTSSTRGSLMFYESELAKLTESAQAQ